MNPRSILPLLLAAGFSFATSAVAERNYLSWGFRHDINALTTTQRGVAVAMDRRGYVAATGYNDIANDTWYTARYDSLTGVPLWQKTYSNGVGDDRPIAIVTDSQGNVIVGGFSTSQNQRDFYTIKYAALTGNVLWQKRFNNSAQNGNDEITAMTVDSFDNVIVTGKSFDSGKQEDFYTIKYNGANGNELWAKRYGSSFPDKPNAIAVATNGDVVVVGSSRAGSNLCYLTVRYSAASGDLQWTQTFDSNQNDDDEATGVAVAADGSVLVTGMVRMIGATYAYHTIKYPAAGGSPVWSRTYQAPGGNNKTPPFIGVNSAGDALISGTANLDNFKTVYYAAKYQASNGTLLWENTTNAPQGSPANTLVNDQVSDMVVDNEGNVIVTGKSYLPATDNDLLTVKFRAKDGRLLWQQRLNGDADKGIDTAARVAVDAAGDVAVTGTTDKGNQNNYYQMITVRYKRFLLSVGDPVSGPGLSPAATISALTAPATFEDGSIVTRITVKDGAKRYGAILPTSIGGNTVSVLQGQPAPGVTNGKFAVFNNPVCSPNGSYAFVASMTGVPSAEKTGVWTTTFNGHVHLALQVNKQVPGLDSGILLKSVVNISQGNGYVAALVNLKGTGVTAANNSALFGLDADGYIRQLLRRGDKLGASTLKTFSLLAPVPFAQSTSRSFNSNGSVTALLTFTNHPTAIVRIGMP